VDRSLQQIHIFGGIVIFLFLAINVWIAIDHLQIERRNQKKMPVGALEETKLLAEQRSALLAARPDSGPIDLQMMRKVGVRVPESFVHGDSFASPWGASRIVKDGTVLTWDFYEITTTGCTQLLGGGAITGVFRVAASSRAADEKQPPLTREVAAQECRRTPLMVRLMLQ
jgi:hypothetical protein